MEKIGESEMTTEQPQKHIEKGKNVILRVLFIRHGEKDKETDGLTEGGKEEAIGFGKNLRKAKLIKGYSSSLERAVQTTEQIIGATPLPPDKKRKTRIRQEIGMPPFSAQATQYYRDLEAIRFGKGAEWWLSFGESRPDEETWSPRETAESFAYALRRYFKMPDKLYVGSEADLINGTHQALPEALLKEVLIREQGGEKIVGFDKLEEIGGALKLTEGMEFDINVDAIGQKTIKLHLRGREYDIDLEKLNKLAESYEAKKHESGGKVEKNH